MMKEDKNFRLMKENDVEKVVKLVRTSFKEEYLIASIYRTIGIQKFITYELKNKFSNYKYYVLTKGEEIVAFAEYKLFHHESIAFLNIIAVNKKYKNEGIGKSIMTNSIKKLKTLSYNKIQLDVFNSNKIAYNWYVAMGFKNKNSTNFYKINFLSTTSDNFKININNFTQHKISQKHLGHSILDITINNQNDKIGIVSNDFVLRSEFLYQHINEIFYLSKKMKINNLYLFGSYKESSINELLETITRMELVLS